MDCLAGQSNHVTGRGLSGNHIVSVGSVLPTERCHGYRELSPTVSNAYTEHFEKAALDMEQHKPSLWLRYIHDILVVRHHNPQQLKKFLSHHNTLRPSTMKMESCSGTPFLDVLVIGKDNTWPPKSTENPPTLVNISTSILSICCV